MQTLKRYITSITDFCKFHIRGIVRGWMLAIHIDTRAIEFNSGLVAIFTGIMLSLPPQDVVPNWISSEYWGWIYLVWGIVSCMFSTYGPYEPRKWTSLVGVYLWSVLSMWIFSEEVKTVDKVWICVFPYIIMAGSSVFTYLGLWRYSSKWNYYNESYRNN